MTLDIKICGLRTQETIDTALTNGANHIGFVFFSKSSRNISLPLAASMRDDVGSHARVVAVTPNADNMRLDEIVYQVKPDLLQLHGAETPRRVAEIKHRYKLPVMKSIAIHNRSDLQNIMPYRSIADRILFDAKAPKCAALSGGNGISFDWYVLDALDEGMDYMLSGGLRAENVVEALAATRTRGIDVSSGVGTESGVKDVHRIKAFLETVLNAYNDKAKQDGI